VTTLVAGGAGYIGSVLTRLLLAQGHQIVVLDDLSTGHADAMPSGADLIQTTDAGKVLAGAGFDAVLHFAVNPSLYWRTIVDGTRALLDAVTENGVPRLVFPATAATSGEPETVPITEDAATRPATPYKASELAVDRMITGECGATTLAAAALRYFNVADAADGAGERRDPSVRQVLGTVEQVTGHPGPVTRAVDRLDWIPELTLHHTIGDARAVTQLQAARS
jgi:UDP-glucose 4-epimerase